MSELTEALDRAMRSTDWTSCSRHGRCADMAVEQVKQTRLIAVAEALLSFA